MIGREEFDRRSRAWTAGELNDAESAEMEAFLAAHPATPLPGAEADAFDDVVRRALLADADGRRVVADALVRARMESAAPREQPAAAPRPRARVVQFPGWMKGVAVAASLVVGVMWFECIPPFECGSIEAMEAAARAPAVATEECEGRCWDCVPLGESGKFQARRSRVPVGGVDATLISFPPGTVEPSIRRRCEREGSTWWIAEEGGDNLVAFRDPADGRLWCFVGPIPQETLLRSACELRDQRSRTQK